MAPSTRTKAHCGATTTGTIGPTVSNSSVMRTRSGIAINPPTDQYNKHKRRTIHQLSPVTDNPNSPKPHPLARRTSSMTFEDYAQILAHPRKPKVKPTVDSVLSDTQLKSDCAPGTNLWYSPKQPMLTLFIAASATDDEDDGMGNLGDNDDHDKNPNEGNDPADEDKEKEGEDEENEDKENQDSGRAKTSPGISYFVSSTVVKADGCLTMKTT